MGALWNLLFFIVAIGILVAVHEAGHFYAARCCGVFCERFSIGFGKVLWCFKDKKGTEYAISAIPLGGYVKMKGERGEKNFVDVDSFASQSILKRAFIIGAGPLSNIILAVILYFIAAMAGTTQLRPVIGYVAPGSAAFQSGLVTGSLITEVGGVEVNSWTETILRLVENLGAKTQLKIVPFEPVPAAAAKDDFFEISDDRLFNLIAAQKGSKADTVTLNLEDITLEADSDILKVIGITPMYGLSTTIITFVEEGGPGFLAGLRPGDEILGIDGKTIYSWEQVQHEVKNSDGRELLFLIRREGRDYRAFLNPQLKCDSNGYCTNRIGVGSTIYPLDNITTIRKYGPVEGLSKALTDTAQMSLFIVRSTVMLIKGTISADNISGPISIARGAGQSASHGLIFFIGFLAAVSVNLGILNLLPIPVLDGGQLLFLAFEAVTQRKPSARVQAWLTAFGISFLVVLSLFAIFNDLRAL